MDKFRVIIPQNHCDEDCDCCCWKDYEDTDESYSPDIEDYDTDEDIYEHTELTAEEKLELLEELASLEEREVTSSLPDIEEEACSIFFKVAK
jgi:hypothetical protein